MKNSDSKPLIKDMVSYFMDNENWVTIWHSDEANLRIERLKHTSVTRLVHTDVEDPYIGIHNEVITYSIEAKDLQHFDPYLGRYLRNRPNNEEIKNVIKHQWRDNDAY